ncbi:membrane protein [Puia dinghuensis]|uniref:Membrane protein n=2 Tax=Puia dinghuensis TaxID=1792502 RepID=A0A8J2UCH1_9BACT|nr:membrane protein [Puia dinghuensis]
MSILVSLSAFSQTPITLTGTVRQSTTKDIVPAVSVTIKGTSIGTITDGRGNFRLSVTQQPPFVLVFSSIGYQTQEVNVTGTGEALTVDLVPSSTLGREVVVSATRAAIRSLESPVSIERIGAAEAHNVPAPSFYDAIANLKGVDVVTSSMLFKTPGTRGFNGSGNLRMNQLVDGMDNQAPGLNFSVGNIVGLSELDLDNVELLPGASSVLYGSGGMTGTLLMTSKDPFKYQGFSAQYKQGVNHIGDDQSSAKPFYNVGARYAQAFNNKFAFRISGDYTKGTDWMASDTRDYHPVTGLITSDKDHSTAPDYDGINVYGDESAYFNVKSALSNASKQYAAAAAAYAAAGDAADAAKYTALSQGAAQASALTPANSNVSRTGYAEKALTNYDAYNFKVSGGLYYKVTPGTTLSLTGNFGMASTVYQGTDRYSLKNVKIGQYKAEIKGEHFYVRAYTTQENAGDSYDMVAVATLMNEAYLPTGGQTGWAATYLGAYAQALQQAYGAGQSGNQAYLTASNAARGFADAGRFQPGSVGFNTAFGTLKNNAIPYGGKFNDQTNLYAGDAMYNFGDVEHTVDVTVGASTREFVLNSHGTIFADTAGRININESGAFAQLQRAFFDDVLKLTGAVRWDKNSNFKDRFTPRFTALFKIAKDNYIRASFQTAYRFPSTQNQFINLQTGSARLIGGLPQFISYYGLNDGHTYDTATLNRFAATGQLGSAYQYQQFKPETVASWELGYKGVIADKLLIDVYGFYAQYTNFIGLTVLVKDPFATGSYVQNAANTFGLYTNSTTKVNTVGAGISLDYRLPGGYIAGANYAYNNISDASNGQQTDFNTPKNKFNLSFANYTIAKYYGFNVTYRWQQEYLYQSSFITGITPAFGTLDAQVSMKIPHMTSSVIKIGATNLLNKYYVDAIGNANIGGLYYISFGYNIL